MENPIKMDDLGVPLFSETSFYIYIYYKYVYIVSFRNAGTAHHEFLSIKWILPLLQG